MSMTTQLQAETVHGWLHMLRCNDVKHKAFKLDKDTVQIVVEPCDEYALCEMINDLPFEGIVDHEYSSHTAYPGGTGETRHFLFITIFYKEDKEEELS